MKKLFCIFAAIALISTGCDTKPAPVAVTGVMVQPKTHSLHVGEDYLINATVTPADAENPAVRWSSDNPAAVIVDAATGTVNALAEGTATITATTTDGGFTATCTVTAYLIHITEVDISEKTLTLVEYDTHTLSAITLPANADNSSILWSSSNDSVARVDPDTGEMTAVSPGEAVITVIAADGGITATCVVTVIPETDVLPLIPDAKFLAYCRKKMYDWDTNRSGKLSFDEAAEVVYIDVSNDERYEGDKITSLEGIEHFTGLTVLRCNFNDLASIDLSKNTSLVELRCKRNRLTSLDVSKNVGLDYLDCSYNLLSSLDVSNNPSLKELLCYGRYDTPPGLTSLDVSNNPALEVLVCTDNFLISLDLSNCPALKLLYCDYNRLSSLDVSANTSLTYLNCGDNRLTRFDVSQNIELLYLACSNNMLTSLDVYNNVNLTTLYCMSNKLSKLNISKNTLLKSFGCESNPGNRVSTFPVTAWFDNNSIPPGNDTANFAKGSWEYEGRPISVDYRKVQ